MYLSRKEHAFSHGFANEKKNMLLDLGFPSSDGKFQGINYWSENNIALLVSRKSHQRCIYKQCTLIRINSHTHISLLLIIIIFIAIVIIMVIVNIIKYYYILLSLLLLYIIIPLYYIYIYIHQLYFPSELWITKWHLHFLPSILANSWVISAVSRSQAGWYLISSQKRPVREDIFAKLPLLKCPCELYKGSTTLVNIRVRTQTTLHLPTHTKKQGSLGHWPPHLISSRRSETLTVNPLSHDLVLLAPPLVAVHFTISI